jgi:hypothetical protein
MRKLESVIKLHASKLKSPGDTSNACKFVSRRLLSASARNHRFVDFVDFGNSSGRGGVSVLFFFLAKEWIIRREDWRIALGSVTLSNFWETLDKIVCFSNE